MNLERLISCIRKVIWYPINDTGVLMNTDNSSYFRQMLYRTNCICTLRIDGGYANINVEIHADTDLNAYLVECNRFSGERYIFYAFFRTLRKYLESGGTIEPNIYEEYRVLQCGSASLI